MTLEEAIAHAREVAERQRSTQVKYFGRLTCDSVEKCRKCEEEHEQLAEWLEELKAIKENQGLFEENMLREEADKIEQSFYSGYNKAIDDFAEKLKPILNEKIKGWTNSDDLIRWCNNSVDEISEQLKAGEENE